MSPTAIGAIVGATALALMGAGLWVLKNENDALRESQGVLQAQLATSEATVAAMRVEQAKNQEFADERARIAASHERDMARAQNTINEQRATIERDSVLRPFDTGIDANAWLARWMRAIRCAGDDNCKSTAVSPTGSTQPGANNILVVTPEVAERWRELCEDGQVDFCTWAVYGFTAQGWLNFQAYLLDLQRAFEQLHANEQYLRDTVSK